MPSAYPLLPVDPPTPYIKPTLDNTNGGKTYKPTHPDLFRVEFTSSINGQEGFSSRLVAERDLTAGERICGLDNVSLAQEKAYSSVQFGTGPQDHLELNSDLLFMNHSCDPSVSVVLPSGKPREWAVRPLRDIKKGEDLTFFYPSTEWDMAQGFDCSCGASGCIGKITGAKHISVDDLEQRGGMSAHIRTLKEQREEMLDHRS